MACEDLWTLRKRTGRGQYIVIPLRLLDPITEQDIGPYSLQARDLSATVTYAGGSFELASSPGTGLTVVGAPTAGTLAISLSAAQMQLLPLTSVNAETVSVWLTVWKDGRDEPDAEGVFEFTVEPG
jgi:hypothetical protein